MNDFLRYLADRKYGYYYGLYKLHPHALTEGECVDRMQRIARYKELINLIDNLPLEHKRVVDKLFDEKMLSA
ncbi:hypothetical protein [Heyndrickxia sporothermodurans]|uniref:Uncharacterized protein n=1 Tax=Heyndrickxia sporothermodurans TaxID=46224 RepID=A0AB37HBA6_9BACI|nr:hypothetical protein [Heyndrickxia sporothermodurans]MED1711731.1 hypothetical protein [Bacillus thuringiensis]MBL5767994.1 hypothetical protein [Heyndrickxia sporothermodurans]MBL5771587.1 hypothetical protein [Heyndrickxia sporothermodurans]MBL5785873.1 hypothetical protein [Heyndrickxia sporothermodurans]MBL5789379.1 hypothetical protein [Heyndrickxia sporothermodurans]